MFNPTYGVQAKLEQDALMPAFSATFINNDHQFRLAYSETVSRPDFRELSPVMFTNLMTGTEVVGNPNLKITDIRIMISGGSGTLVIPIMYRRAFSI